MKTCSQLLFSFYKQNWNVRAEVWSDSCEQKQPEEVKHWNLSCKLYFVLKQIIAGTLRDPERSSKHPHSDQFAGFMSRWLPSLFHSQITGEQSRLCAHFAIPVGAT